MRPLPLRLRPVVLALAVAFAGCAARPVRGIVGLEAGQPVLLVDGVAVALRGPPVQLAQLARLRGAVVDVSGPSTDSAQRALDFEIVDAGDGFAPLVGRVVVDQAGVQLEDDVTGTRLALRGEALAELRALHGARVWVTGSVVGPQLLLVAHHGVLLLPGEGP